MRKLLAFVLVCTLALVFAKTSVADENQAVKADAEVTATDEAVNPCGCIPAPAPCLLGSLFRRPCTPSYASPCNPCPVVAPYAPCARRIFAPCDAAPHFAAPCAGYQGYQGFGAGYQGYGYGQGYGPVRSLIARLFYGLRGGYAPAYGGGIYAEPGFGYGFGGCGCGAAPVTVEIEK